MFRRAAVTGLPKLSRHDRALLSESRRVLERELADYSSDADRNDLQVLVDASITSAAWEVSAVLGRQAHARLHRVS